MMWTLVGFSCFLALVSSQTTQVSQCTVNNAPLPINVEVEGCITPPCLLPQLQDVVLNIIFRAPHTIHNMRTLVRAYLIGNIPIPYDLGDEAITCNFLTNSYCPVLENEELQYTLRMYIKPIFPVGIAPTLEFYVQDSDTSESLFCLRVKIRITEPESSSSLASNSTVLKVHVITDLDSDNLLLFENDLNI